MCEPVTALLVGTAANAAAGTAATAGLIGAGGAVSSGFMAATSALSTASGLYGQQKAASMQAAANQRQYENTVRSYNANLNQTNLMAEQERASAMQKLDENALKARAAQSTASVAAGEAGISGLSVDALLGEISNKQNRYDTSVMTNLDRTNSAIQSKRDNVFADASSTINGLKTPPMPDYLGAALKITGTVSDYTKKK